MNQKLYVGNLNYEVTAEDLRTLFCEHGDVVSATVISDRATGQSKGFGFVEMGSGDEAETAMNALNGQQFKGRSLNISEARPKPSFGGAGGGHAR